jgi:hypothetical protein
LLPSGGWLGQRKIETQRIVAISRGKPEVKKEQEEAEQWSELPQGYYKK